jgi:hypothetical protein
MNTKIKIIKGILSLSIISLLFVSCTKDSASSTTPQINGIYAYDGLNQTENSGKGFPGDLVKVEGSGLEKVKSIVFDNLVNVVFNPSLNSDKAVLFPVTFDDKKGSRFGLQPLTITKESGAVIRTEFEILQPKAIINSFNPLVPKVGTTVSVNGIWFFDVSSVTFGGVAVPFTRVSPILITFLVPANATAGADVAITTPGGVGKKFMDIDQGFDVVRIADFDGGGLRPNNDWVKYGDFNTFGYSNIGGTTPTSNYAELTWAGKTTNGYNGCQSGAGAAFMPQTDPTKVYYQIDVNNGGATNTIIELLIVDSDGGNWAYRYKIVNTGWQTVEAQASLFGANYDPNNQGSGDVNPSKINQVKMTIAQNGGTPNPSKVQFDNIRFKVIR